MKYGCRSAETSPQEYTSFQVGKKKKKKKEKKESTEAN